MVLIFFLIYTLKTSVPQERRQLDSYWLELAILTFFTSFTSVTFRPYLT